jgi:hypothetical protein
VLEPDSFCHRASLLTWRQNLAHPQLQLHLHLHLRGQPIPLLTYLHPPLLSLLRLRPLSLLRPKICSRSVLFWSSPVGSVV